MQSPCTIHLVASCCHRSISSLSLLLTIVVDGLGAVCVVVEAVTGGQGPSRHERAHAHRRRRGPPRLLLLPSQEKHISASYVICEDMQPVSVWSSSSGPSRRDSFPHTRRLNASNYIMQPTRCHRTTCSFKPLTFGIICSKKANTTTCSEAAGRGGRATLPLRPLTQSTSRGDL